MANEILVTDFLSDQMIYSGRKLIERLDDLNAQIKSAFWLYSPEFRTWSLILSADSVASDGPRKLYEKILISNNLAEKTEKTISLNDIGLMSSDQKIVQLLAMVIRTGPEISGIRFTRNNINGIYIDDAYIYRSQS
jgi:hypothetical protein